MRRAGPALALCLLAGCGSGGSPTATQRLTITVPATTITQVTTPTHTAVTAAPPSKPPALSSALQLARDCATLNAKLNRIVSFAAHLGNPAASSFAPARIVPQLSRAAGESAAVLRSTQATLAPLDRTGGLAPARAAQRAVAEAIVRFNRLAENLPQVSARGRAAGYRLALAFERRKTLLTQACFRAANEALG
jgi:hypothetical protein